MKRILGAIALGVALSLSIAATPSNEARSADCKSTTDLNLGPQVGISLVNSMSTTANSIEGNITNMSSNQGYDNVQLRVDYFDSENESVGSQTLELNKDIDPGETESFSETINTPTGATTAVYSVECAEQDRGWLEKIQFWKS